MLLVSMLSAQAHAQPTTGAQPAHASASEPSQAAKDEARTRFTRALELAEDGSMDAALEELKRAYALAPSYRILYNIGLVYQSLQDYSRSLDAYEQYLEQGGAEIPAERISEVNGRMERLKGRVGYLDIRVNEPGATISVDDLPVGQAPLPTKIRVKSGRRRVTVNVAGRAPSTQAIELAGAETKLVTFDLHVVPPVIVKEPKKSPVPWIAWGVTAALAAGAVTTGILALNAGSEYDDRRQQFSPNGADTLASLNDLDRKAANFALVTDILGAAAIVGAGVSIYFTIRPPKVGASASSTAGKLGVFTTGRAASLRYTF